VIEQRYGSLLRRVRGAADLTGLALRVRVHAIFWERKGRALVSYPEAE
jgi:hypothetical protein